VGDLQSPRVETKTAKTEGNRRLFNGPDCAEVVTQGGHASAELVEIHKPTVAYLARCAPGRADC
jgi:hypothetical protein